MEFIEAPAFSRQLAEYMTDEEFRQFQAMLLENPEAGRIIPETGGFRKIRWGEPGRGIGKRGGLRIIYCYFLEDEQTWLLTLYGKDEADDLTADQKKALKRGIEQEKRERAEVRNSRSSKRR